MNKTNNEKFSVPFSMLGKLSDSDILLLSTINNLTLNDGYTTENNSTISSIMGWSKDKTKRILAKLVKYRHIKSEVYLTENGAISHRKITVLNDKYSECNGEKTLNVGC